MIDGILLLDKPVGLSSAVAGRRVQRLLGARKAGHVGSLDPLASGMLPICLGEATKLAGEILEGHKVYRFTIALGARTATGDREGVVLEQLPVPALQPADVDGVLARFVGAGTQIPPMYSALKQAGQPLYRLARAGLDVERAARPIWIGKLERLALGADYIEARVECGKGTYVRVLAEDIARALGTAGHVAALRRESVQPFAPDRMVSFEELETGCARGVAPPLLSLDEAVGHLPLCRLDSEQTRRMVQGQSLRAACGTGLPPGVSGQTVRLHDANGRFLGLGRYVEPGLLQAKRLVAQGGRE